ncbi:MAG: RNA polymerase sigma factor [Rhodothermaceae bacterium]
MANTDRKISELYVKYQNDIFYYSLGLMKNEDDAKDVVQEVFLRCNKNLGSFRGDCTEKTWLMVIARNYCYKLLKAKKLLTDPLDDFKDEKIEINIDEKLTLDEALNSLSKENFEILYLKEYAGYSYKEIAEIMDISLSNVKIKLFRIRQQLRKNIER